MVNSENFEVFINESVTSKANTKAMKSGHWQQDNKMPLKFPNTKHI